MGATPWMSVDANVFPGGPRGRRGVGYHDVAEIRSPRGGFA